MQFRSRLRCDDSIDCVDESDEENCWLVVKSTFYNKYKVVNLYNIVGIMMTLIIIVATISVIYQQI